MPAAESIAHTAVVTWLQTGRRMVWGATEAPESDLLCQRLKVQPLLGGLFPRQPCKGHPTAGA